MKILITSGGTKVKIDDVRSLTNVSTGRFGAEIAYEFAKEQNLVNFLCAKGSVQPLSYHNSANFLKGESLNYQYNDYFEYLKGSVELSKSLLPDIIISAAAVSDYIVAKAEGKLPSDEDEMIIRLKKAQKVLPLLKAASPKSMVVGFKLLVSPAYDQVVKAVQKVLNNGADYVVYNDLAEIKKGNSSRLIFKKDMTFTKINDAKQLVQYITNEYSTWPNGQRSYYGG